MSKKKLSLEELTAKAEKMLAEGRKDLKGAARAIDEMDQALNDVDWRRFIGGIALAKLQEPVAGTKRRLKLHNGGKSVTTH